MKYCAKHNSERPIRELGSEPLEYGTTKTKLTLRPHPCSSSRTWSERETMFDYSVWQLLSDAILGISFECAFAVQLGVPW